MVGADNNWNKEKHFINYTISKDVNDSKLKLDFNILNTTCIEPSPLNKSCKTYPCLICKKIFSRKYSYEDHLRSHKKEGDSRYYCNICQKSFSIPARLSRHYRIHTGEKPFQCEYCSKFFSVKENLSVHRRIHTKERPYKCNVCGAAFEHSGKLHRHMRIHTGERPHKCSLCNKTFIQSGQLVIHMRTHTGEKPYMCKTCKKGFTCSKQLKVHTRTHTGEKPYKCEICNKSFGYSHVLKLHQVSHYGEKFYKCTLCQENFSNRKLMDLHTNMHSNSFHNDSETSNKLFIKTQNINKMIVCNKSYENKMFIIASVNEKKNPKFVFPVVPNEEKEQGEYSKVRISKMITDPSYLPMYNCVNQHKVPRYHFANLDSSNSLLYKFKNSNSISSPEILVKSLEEKKEVDLKYNFGRQDKTRNLRYEKNCKAYKINPLLSKESLECLIPKITSNIDTSIERYKTVIRFANVDTII